MTAALWLLGLLGALGALDTVYYHEWRARLPARVPGTTPELRLHAARDFFYAILFGTLPVIQWRGAWTLVLVVVIVIEIVLTLWDFVVEVVVRRPLGDVYAGERVMHAVMGIVYGAMVAWLIPALSAWWESPTALVWQQADVPAALVVTLHVMAVGVSVGRPRLVRVIRPPTRRLAMAAGCHAVTAA